MTIRITARFAHGAMNGQDFWSEEKAFGKTVHEEFLEVKSGKDVGVIKSRNKWVASDGTVVCTDDRTLRIYNPGRANERVLDFDITLFASNGELTLGDTKEGATVRPGANARTGATITGRSRGRRSASPFSIIPKTRVTRPGGMCAIMGCSRPIRLVSMISRALRIRPPATSRCPPTRV